MPNGNQDGQLRSYNQAELNRFDGKEGRPLYIVFEGKIYDLTQSRLWLEGKHMGVHTRNENLTDTIRGAPHSREVLERFPLVGRLEEQPTAGTSLIKKTEEPAKPLAEVRSQPAMMSRREFLKLTAATGGAVTLLGMASLLRAGTFIPTSVITSLAWPKINVTNLSSLQLLTPVTFNYPLDATPNILVKLGVKAQGGVGPDGDIVAFSGICQHFGCFYGFVPQGGLACKSYTASVSGGYCCCHGSQYDFVNAAKVVGGPAPRPVPQVQLEYDSSTGNINALSMGPPTIFGHGPPGTTDPALVLQYDLQGGTVVSGT